MRLALDIGSVVLYFHTLQGMVCSCFEIAYNINYSCNTLTISAS